MVRRFVMGSVLALCSLCVSGECLSAETKKPPKVTYDDHVLPIFRDACIGCHNPDKARGGLVLNNYTKLMEGGSSGAVIQPSDPGGSRLFLLVSHQQQPHMPPKSPMIDKKLVDTIERWIAGGALENNGSTAKIVNKPKVELSLSAVQKGRPPGPPPMPEGRLTLDPFVVTARPNAVTALASNPWSPLVAVGGQHQVLLYNADTRALLGVLPFPEGEPCVLKFSRNGSLLLAGGGVGGKSGKVVVWSVKTGERLFAVGDEADQVLAADISADQTQIALGGPSKVVRVYSTKDGSLLREIKKHTDWVYSVDYSPDGVLLATGDRNGGLFVWEAFTGREYFALRGHTGAVTAVSWRPDANMLASASEDTTVRLWEMENGGQVKSWGGHGGGTEWVQYGQDGRLVTCGRDHVVRVWDGNGGQQRVFEAMPDVTLRAAFSHDGSRVIAGDWTGQVHVWAVADGKFQGNLSSNPPKLTDQVEIATKDLAARQAEHQQKSAAATASQAAAQKAAADLAAAQKAAAAAPITAKTTAEAAAKAKDAAAKANAALATAKAPLAAREVTAKAYAEAAAKVNAAADAAKADKELAAAATKSQALASEAATESAATQKTIADATALAKTAADQLAAAQKVAAEAAAAVTTAPKLVTALTAAAKAAADKATADQAAANQAAAALATARAQVERLNAALGLAKQAKK
jgi:WD40 repeat protein